MAILSIQSHVVYGHAGNSAAVFPLQKLGHTVWAINTVEFSNHTGYGAWTGRVLDAALAGELVQGLADRGVLFKTEAVLSGYMGDAGVGKAVLDAVERVRAENPDAVYCCDPVMGDVGRGFYVKPGIPEMFKNEVIPKADIVTPNQFELEALTGIKVVDMDSAHKAILSLHAMGPKVVLVTSFKGAGDAENKPHIDMVVSNGEDLFRSRTPELFFPFSMAGSGDLTAAVFLSHFLKMKNVKRALERTTGSVYGIMSATCRAKSRELLIIEAQEELLRPGFIFEAIPLRK
jgi:pyridoxine kinase